MHHSILPPHVGFGNSEGLAGKRRNLRHYLDRPATYAHNSRAQGRIKELSREIEEMEKDSAASR